VCPRTGREITDSTLELYGEYGISDHPTLVGSLPFKIQEAGDKVANPTISPISISSGSLSRLGNLRVGVRRKFIDNKIIFSGQFDLKLPTGTFDELGFGLRTDDFSNDWRACIESGVRLFGRL